VAGETGGPTAGPVPKAGGMPAGGPASGGAAAAGRSPPSEVRVDAQAAPARPAALRTRNCLRDEGIGPPTGEHTAGRDSATALRYQTGSMPLPLLIVTGFLGAGKTTALNRLLLAATGRRLAVLVNDLGTIPIDRALLAARAGDLVELSGGCVCCTIDVNRDLWETLPELVRRTRADGVVLETTGAAEPGPLVAGGRARGFAPRVACVVDASTPALLERHPEARAQAEGADGLLLTKLDLAGAAEAAATHALLDGLAPRAPRVSFPAGREAELAAWLVDLPPLARAAAVRPARRTQLVAVSLAVEGPLLLGPLVALLEELGDRLVRAKGFVRVAGEEARVYVEKAGDRIGVTRAVPGAGDADRCELVLIGPGLDEAALRRRVWACQPGR
jgi:G3E family GTPase